MQPLKFSSISLRNEIICTFTQNLIEYTRGTADSDNVKILFAADDVLMTSYL